MNFLMTLVFLIWSFTASACLKIEGDFIVNNNKTHLNQKIDFGKNYSYMLNNYILHLKFISPDHKDIQIETRLDHRIAKAIKKSPIKKFELVNDFEHEIIFLNESNNSIKLKLKAISI